jgi:hypothetical protein
MISAGSDGGDTNWALALFDELRLPAIQAPAAVNVAMPWAGINIGPEALNGTTPSGIGTTIFILLNWN